jgi:hypothetical protein
MAARNHLDPLVIIEINQQSKIVCGICLISLLQLEYFYGICYEY